MILYPNFQKGNFEAELSIEMEAAAAIMSHYDKLCCSVLCHTKWNHPQSVEDMQKIKPNKNKSSKNKLKVSCQKTREKA